MFNVEFYTMSAIIFMQGKLMQGKVEVGESDVQEVVEFGCARHIHTRLFSPLSSLD